MGAAHLVAGLRGRYAAPEWELYSEVRSTTGCHDVLRTADAIAVNLWTPDNAWRIHGFEMKTSRADWLRELRQPEKSGPIKLFCSAWYVVVAAPWKRVLITTRELPNRWGLIEIGTGKANVVVVAEEREAEEPTPGFLRALLRAARREPDGDELGAAPLVRIERPNLSRTQVGLECGHTAARPLSKIMPERLRCVGCADGRPTDRALVEGAIDDASDEELRAYAAGIQRQIETRGLLPILGCAS